MKKVRRLISLATAQMASSMLKFWRKDNLNYSPEEWRQMRISFADSGEDLVVFDYLKKLPKSDRGIYIDAGAFDPVLISNTMLLYKNGWQGLVVDANPRTIEKFQSIRPRDNSVWSALSDRHEKYQYLEYPVPGNNRLAPLGAEDEKSMIGEEPIKRSPIESRTLDQILQENYKVAPKIDFLSIDCEGYDHLVLKGLNLNKYRPRIICTEEMGRLCVDSEDTSKILLEHGYTVFAKLGLNLIFLDTKSDSGCK